MDLMNLRDYAICHRGRSETVKENEIESMISNISQYQITMFLAVGYAPFSPIAPQPLGAAYVPFVQSEVVQEQRPSGNGDREATVVGAGLCDGERERAYTVYGYILGGETYLKSFTRI